MFKLFTSSIKNALTKTRSKLSDKIKDLFIGTYDESTLERFEELLFEADLGSDIAEHLTEHLKSFLRKTQNPKPEKILQLLKDEALSILSAQPAVAERENTGLQVILCVGVNGSGKTTTLAKLSARFKKQGKRVMLGAADTFRAAAQEQLTLWAEKIGCDIVTGVPQADPASVVFDTLKKALDTGCDVALIDTAGRLQSKDHLMRELQKIHDVCQKLVPNAPHKTMLIIDSTMGQNGLDQARIFNQFTPLSAITVTKLDGSAKGGIILPIYKELKVPIEYIGIGEKQDDLVPFDAKAYIDALF